MTGLGALHYTRKEVHSARTVRARPSRIKERTRLFFQRIDRTTTAVVC